MQMSAAALFASLLTLVYVAAGADVESAGLNAVSARRVRAPYHRQHKSSRLVLSESRHSVLTAIYTCRLLRRLHREPSAQAHSQLS